MPLDWLDVSTVPFNSLLLLERAQLRWLPGWNFPRPQIGQALAANPVVAWYLCHKCPEITPWVEAQLAGAALPADPAARRAAEAAVLAALVDLMVYALDPAAYDRLPFTRWDDRELTRLVDFTGRRVVDVGAGTGRLALTAARNGARCVYAVDPVENLRRFLLEKARAAGLERVYAVDGLITAIPFEADFADVTLGGHVFGDEPEAEWAELERVTRPGGWIVLMPGNNDVDDDRHAFLAARGCQWAVFIEPPADRVRKYWKQKEA
jgi:SAM-dependent methyltransferase